MSKDSNIKLRYSLLPLSFIYDGITRLRNYLFDKGILHSQSYPFPVICIGNLSVGGTGKTPHTEYLVRLLLNKYKVGVLSRGYKRKSKDYQIVIDDSTIDEVGDEPYQMKCKFRKTLISVDKNRRHGIRLMRLVYPPIRPEIILLDDALQHRYVTPSLTIMLTDFHRPYYEDKVLPVGNLREARSGASRADIIIMTKCDKDLNSEEIKMLESKMRVRKDQKIFFTGIEYDELMTVFPDEENERHSAKIPREVSVVAIAGIANPQPFINEVKRRFNVVREVIFPDHHAFKGSDIKKIKKEYEALPEGDKILICTDKDAVRLMKNELVPQEWKDKMYSLPIKVKFLHREGFDKLIMDHVDSLLQQNKVE